MILRSIFFVLAIILLFPFPSYAKANQELVVLYFFSSKCPHCREVAPLVNDLSKSYKILGYYPGKEEPPDVPFPAEPGRKDLQKQYDVPGVPSMVVLVNGSVKQKLIGAANIQFAPGLLKAFQQGALTVSEAIKSPLETPLTIAGLLQMQGGVIGGQKAVYYLTDRTTNLPVGPWLPAEAVKSKFQSKRPRLMSDMVNNVVVLKGRVAQAGEGKYRFIVTEEVRSE